MFNATRRRRDDGRIDDLKDLIHPDRAKSDELGRTSEGSDPLRPKSGPREQPAKEVDPLAREHPVESDSTQSRGRPGSSDRLRSRRRPARRRE